MSGELSQIDSSFFPLIRTRKATRSRVWRLRINREKLVARVEIVLQVLFLSSFIAAVLLTGVMVAVVQWYGLEALGLESQPSQIVSPVCSDDGVTARRAPRLSVIQSTVKPGKGGGSYAR